jgi:hypothetical protein
MSIAFAVYARLPTEIRVFMQRLSPLDQHLRIVLLTAPSLRSDTVTPTFDSPVKGRCAGEAQEAVNDDLVQLDWGQ